MSYSNNRFISNNNNSDQKNETVQTIPERDIAIYLPNNANSNTNNNLPSYRATQSYSMNNNQFNKNMNFNNENNSLPQQYSNLNSNLNKLSINQGRSDYQLNSYYNQQQPDPHVQQNLGSYDINMFNRQKSLLNMPSSNIQQVNFI